MSREYTLYSSLFKVDAGNREDLLKALTDMSSFDCDFNGENGFDYAWEETVKAGFESNLEYLLDMVKDIENDVGCLKEFVDTWMENDKDFYSDYNLEYLTDDNGNVIVFNLSVLAGY